MTKREIFRKAIKKIKKYGWTQGVYGDKRKGYCILGAITAVSPRMYKTDPALWDRIWHVLDSRVRGNIVLWNDKDGRTKEEVLALLREMAR